MPVARVKSKSWSKKELRERMNERVYRSRVEEAGGPPTPHRGPP